MRSGVTSRNVIPALLRGDYFTLFEDALIANSGAARLPGQRSAGYVEKPLGEARYISLPVGANKIYEVCYSGIVDQITGTGAPESGWAQPFDYSRPINPNTPLTVATGDCFMGIQYGSLGIAPPWNAAAFAVTPPSGSAVQLRYNYTLTRFEFAVFGDQVNNADVAACSYQPEYEPDTGVVEFRLIYSPTPRRFTAYLNQRFAGTWTADDLPQIGELTQTGSGEMFGYFVTNGSTSTNQMNEIGFYRAAIYRPRMVL